jgi:non-specific protein-tyrosine kinase
VHGEDGDGRREFRDLLRVLRRRRWIVVVTTVVVVGVAMVASFLQTPVYSAAARMLIQPRPGNSPFEVADGQRSDTAQFIATEIEVLEGEPVQEEVRRRLGSAPPISASAVGTTAVVRIVAEDPDPKVAAAVANAYVEAYITNRRQQGIDESLAAQKEVQGKLDLLQGRIDGLDGQLEALEGEFRTPEGSVAESLQAQRQALVQQQALFKQTLDQQQVNMALITGGAQVVRTAAVPTAPVKPRPVRNGILALAVGLMLGAGRAFMVDYFDDSIESQEDLERITGTVPVMGQVPAVTGWKIKEKPRLVAVEAPQSPAAEAYRALRTAIDFIALDHPMRTLQVTSPNAGEGKTTTLGNLAVTLAMAGKRVVVVCCDLRRPRIHEFFGLTNTVGFTSALLGEVPVQSAVQVVPGIPRLRLLASGPLPPNPSELLSSVRTGHVFAALAAGADIVLIDSPPVLPVTDALVLFRHVDSTLMVFSAGTTTRKAAGAALAKVRQVNGPVIGAVLNGVKSDSGYGYTYAYETGAGAEGGNAGVKDEPARDWSVKGGPRIKRRDGSRRGGSVRRSPGDEAGEAPVRARARKGSPRTLTPGEAAAKAAAARAATGRAAATDGTGGNGAGSNGNLKDPAAGGPPAFGEPPPQKRPAP